MAITWNISTTMQEQINAFSDEDAQQLALLKRAIRFQVGHDTYRQHQLQGLGAQTLLQGCQTLDFQTGGLGMPGRWRLLYDLSDVVDDQNFSCRLLGVVDYHGGVRHAPLYRLNRTIDLSD